MFGGSSPAALSSRFTAIAQNYIADGPAERADRARRKLLAAIGECEPATLKQVAAAVHRGEPAVSRSIESLVKAGLVDRAPDPTNRRRLAIRLSEAGRHDLEHRPSTGNALENKLGRLAQSELRAIERAVEILER
jgi:DNA-binding MarR family transcriptional regulator